MANSAELKKLFAKDPKTWSVAEVGQWVDFSGLSEYKISFIENYISGEELFDLDEDDLFSIGVQKLGHRKKFMQLIKDVKDGNSGPQDSKSRNDDDDTSSMGSSQSAGSAATRSNKISVKLVLKSDVRKISVKQSITLDDLKKKIRSEFKKRVDLFWQDKEGDKIAIKKDRHLEAAKNEAGSALTLYLTERVRNVVSHNDTAALDNLVDGCVIIDTKSIIRYANSSVEKIFGWSPAQLQGKSVKILMPQEYAHEHDMYVAQYMQTGVKNVIGTGRKLVAQHRDGSHFPIFLSVSETIRSRGHTFTGVIQNLKGKEALNESEVTGIPDLSSQFAILENLLDCCVVADERGSMLFANHKACEVLGFTTTELVSKNLQMIMPSHYTHEAYMAKYLKQGGHAAVGKTRDVVAQRKNGTYITMSLTVTEQKLGGGRRIFTGILREQDQVDANSQKTILQQQREVMDSLVIPSIIIDDQCIVQGFNNASVELFGYSVVEIVGKNINCLMHSPDKEHHNSYVNHYVKTRKGRGKVIGVGRDVVGCHKSGSLVTLHLSVTVHEENGHVFFTGVMQRTKAQ